MKFISTIVFTICIIFFINYISHAQISHGGKPQSTTQDIQNIDFIKLDNQNKSEEIIEKESEKRLKPFKFANMIDVNLDIREVSISKQTESGTLFLAGIISNSAYSLYPVFSNFNLSGSSSIYIYNPDKSHILGKFTSDNNKQGNVFAIMPVTGDSLIIEYFESDDSREDEIILGQIGHDFIGLSSYLTGSKDGSFGESGDCNIDINCFQGAEWQTEKHTVCRIITNGSLCTGSLVNNTNQDARPFFLTANHCINSQSLADAMLVVFNYESADCNGLDGSVEQSISGGIMRATTHHLDFCLIELTEPPLPSYNPYFAGWNRSDSVEGLTVCIHHPQGDVKKISTDSESPTTGNYGAGYDYNSHWLISDWESGTTEGGSSGSPLFDKYHRLVGDLTGGEANCTFPVNDYYSKFSLAWDSYINHDDQLKYWLDPANTNQETLNGYDPYHGQNQPIAEFSSNRTEILEGSLINFTDLSEGNATSWTWTFTGAIPPQSTEQHPQGIKYTYNGNFQVKLEVTNNYGNDIITKVGYITVTDGCGRFSNIDELEPLYLYGFSGNEWGYWTGHNQNEFSSFAEKYTNQSGHFIHGIYILPAKAYSGTSNSEISINVWQGGGLPGNIIWTNNIEISSFSPGSWKYITIEPALETNGNFYIGYSITYNQADTFAIPHAEPRGPGGLNTAFVFNNNLWSPINEFASEMTTSLCLEPYICGSVSSNEILIKNKLKVYPNPSSDIINIQLEEDQHINRITVINSNGKIVYKELHNKTTNNVSLNISHLSSGIYVIITETDTNIYTNKIHVMSE